MCSKFINKKILQECINTWGEKSQLEMIIEESLELALSLQKYKRKNVNLTERLNDIYSELADMKIMLAQADLIFDKEKIDEHVKFKMNRLEQRLLNDDSKNNINQ